MMRNREIQFPATDLIHMGERDRPFSEQVNRRSGENVGFCFQCRSCAGGCPYVESMDYSPNAVLRLVQLGLRKEALECATIWICVSCNTCSIQCPMAIDIPAIIDTLRHMALEEGANIAEPDIVHFHEEVLHSIERYGRTHKLEIMLRYKVRLRQWFQDMDIGVKMLKKRKLDLKPSKIEAADEMRDIFAFPQKGLDE
jgi:heterodisulfide reductase subunit C2